MVWVGPRWLRVVFYLSWCRQMSLGMWLDALNRRTHSLVPRQAINDLCLLLNRIGLMDLWTFFYVWKSVLPCVLMAPLSERDLHTPVSSSLASPKSFIFLSRPLLFFSYSLCSFFTSLLHSVCAKNLPTSLPLIVAAPNQLTPKNHHFLKDLLPLSSKIYMFGTFEQRNNISLHGGLIVTKMNKLLIESVSPVGACHKLLSKLL